MKGKTNFSRRLKQFDGLTGLTLTPIFCDISMPLGNLLTYKVRSPVLSDGVLEDMSLTSRILEYNFYSPWPWPWPRG